MKARKRGINASAGTKKKSGHKLTDLNFYLNKSRLLRSEFTLAVAGLSCLWKRV